MRHNRLLAGLLLLALTLVAAADLAESQASVALVRNMMTLVRSEFIDEIPPSQLVNGALDGIESALKEKKLPHEPLKKVAPGLSREDALQQLAARFHTITEAHPKLLEDNWLAYEAIKGMLKTLDDDYTVFLDPDEYQRLKESMSGGNFGGLGVYIELDKENENRLTVVEPIEDTPAAEAGLKPRDVILKIDGESTFGFTIEKAQTRLRGEVGSPVVLTIRRVNQAQPFDVEVKRDKIHVNSVRSKLLAHQGRKIGYVRLRMFGERTSEELEEAMRELEREGAEAFLMDLRNNGGGYIVSAVDVCSKFLSTGSRVVSVKERGAGDTIYRSRPNVRKDFPLVVLVNEFSASASEITAAAMQDLKRGKLVGVKTFGKGSVQKIFPLPDGSALKVTTAHYHTPKGKDINKLGVDPDIEVKMKGKRLASPEDDQLKTAADEAVRQLQSDLAAEQRPTARSAVRIDSVEEELAYLRSLGEDFQIVERRIFEEKSQLVEEVKVRFSDTGETRTVRFDISDYLGR